MTADTRIGQDQQIRDQVRLILRQNGRGDLVRLVRLDDRAIDEAMFRANRHKDVDPHEQTQNAAVYIIENAHSLQPGGDDDGGEYTLHLWYVH